MSAERVYRSNIEAEVAELVHFLEIEPESPFADAISMGENNYKTFASDRSGKRVFFKVALVDHRPQPGELQIFPRRGIENEIAVYEALGSPAFSDGALTFPKFNAGDTGRLAWLILEVIEPEVLLSLDHQFFSSEMKPSWIELIVEGVSAYQVLPRSQRQLQRQLPSFDTANLAHIETFLERNERWLVRHLGERHGATIRRMVAETLPIWAGANTYLAHGDLSLQNIGFTSGSLVVLDWEHAHISNPAYDFSKVYVQAWRHEDWRKEFAAAVRACLQTQVNWNLFNMGVVMRGLAEIRYLETCLLNENFGYSASLKRFYPREKVIEVFNQAVRAHEETIANALEDGMGSTT